MLRPIGNRILVKPEANDEESASRIVLVEHRKPEVMGTVIAVGPCVHPLKAEAEALADMLEHQGCTCELCDAARLLRQLSAREPQVKPNDLVLFSWTAGREVTLDDTGDRYLMMTEDDILAVIEP